MRRLIGFLGGVAVLFLLAVAADRIAAGYAAGQLEDQLVAQGFRQPEVTIRGFPFAQQVLDKEYRTVELASDGVQVPEGRAQDVRATLSGVQVDDVTAPRAVRVRTVDAAGTVTYDDVERAAGIPGLILTAAGAGEVRVAGQLELFDETYTVSARGRIDARGDHLLVVPTGLRVEGVGDLDERLTELLAEQIAVDYPIRGLPQGVAVESITGGPRGFVVQLRGRDISLGSVTRPGMT